jgi:predicted nucleotidyltransferase
VVRKMGRSKLYRVNQRHVLYEKIKDLILAERDSYLDIAKEFSEGLEKKHIRNIILFGSVATVLERVETLTDDYDVTIVPVYLSVTEVKDRVRKADQFILNVLEEGEVLYGDAKWLGR